MDQIALTSKELTLLKEILSKSGASKAFLFGSVVNGKFHTTKSDLDILVQLEETDPLKKGETLLRLWDDLESSLNRKIDLLTPESIKNPIFKSEVNRTKVLCYDRKGEKMDA